MTSMVLENPETEPTLREVATAVTELSEIVGDVFDAMKHGFSRLEERIDGLDGRMGSLEDRVEIGFHETNRRLGNLENTAEDIKEDVGALMQAVDIDAKTIIIHEQRIVRLERIA